MATEKRGVVLVGHGGIPKDCPQELVTRLKRLEAQRRAAKQPPSAEELELDMKIRRWPRTPLTDPYQSGLQAVATRLQPHLNSVLFGLAYNEFCAPSLEEAVEHLIEQGPLRSLWRPPCLLPEVLIRKSRYLTSLSCSDRNIPAWHSGMPGPLISNWSPTH